jgi:hypothetical protein
VPTGEGGGRVLDRHFMSIRRGIFVSRFTITVTKALSAEQWFYSDNGVVHGWLQTFNPAYQSQRFLHTFPQRGLSVSDHLSPDDCLTLNLLCNKDIKVETTIVNGFRNSGSLFAEVRGYTYGCSILIVAPKTHETVGFYPHNQGYFYHAGPYIGV